MLPDDGIRLPIYRILAMVSFCVPKITVLNHVLQQFFDDDLPVFCSPLDRQHACCETPGETAQRAIYPINSPLGKISRRSLTLF